MTIEQIIEKMQSVKSFEDKYRFIVQLSKILPAMDEALKQQALEVKGCESQVWLSWQIENDHYHFRADSDARIVKGLIAMVLAAVEGKTKAEILAFDFEQYFAKLDLLAHLSSTRSNGVHAIVNAIQSIK